ncbi:MAG: 1-(5-phosphoribosyl)-5-[(5-phosphoribosylamino)methylideneamino]imidazole-4-carboxamide isomerase [Sedimentisphaerales bacterium]
MYIIPAIDLIEGHCVRLIQGQYDKKINYESDPVKQAQDFINEGAQWLHIVDLEGAKAGKPVNTKAISSIATIGKLKIEVGGGLRTEDSIKHLLDIGVTRAIIGTKAITDFAWLSKMAEKFPGRIVLGLDARGSKVATEGWLEDSSESLLEFAKKAATLPLAAIIYTDITKDGMMAGPNLERTKALVEAVEIPVIASGGVTTVEDIKKTVQTGAAAAIVGRSLFEGTLKLSDAIKAAEA